MVNILLRQHTTCPLFVFIESRRSTRPWQCIYNYTWVTWKKIVFTVTIYSLGDGMRLWRVDWTEGQRHKIHIDSSCLGISSARNSPLPMDCL